MSLQKFLSSRKGRRFYNFAYCWGACMVIAGALFKIMHLPFDNVLLLLGMGVEIFIFFISGFDVPVQNTIGNAFFRSWPKIIRASCRQEESSPQKARQR